MSHREYKQEFAYNRVTGTMNRKPD